MERTDFGTANVWLQNSKLKEENRQLKVRLQVQEVSGIFNSFLISALENN